MADLSAIAFSSESNDGILAWWTKCIADRMVRHGISVETINLRHPDWSTDLSAHLRQRIPDFCFSFQGFGMDLSNGSENLWTAMNVPFVSSMGDAPYWNPNLHNASGKTLVHLYASQDFQEFYHEFMNGRNFSTFVPFGYPSNPHANDVPWHKRDLDLVFVKTGVDPNILRAAWIELSPVVREMLEEASAIVLAGQTRTIGRIVAQIFSAKHMNPAEHSEAFMHICRMVDGFVRAKRAERMVRQIMRHGGHIFGEWAHLDTGKSRAVFHNRIPAGQLNSLYARSRILANTAPCTLTGTHERILAAFQAKSFIVADSSSYLEQRLAAYPSFRSAPIESGEFEDMLDARILEIRTLSRNSITTQALLDDVRVRADIAFGLDQFIIRMFEAMNLLKSGIGFRDDIQQG